VAPVEAAFSDVFARLTTVEVNLETLAARFAQPAELHSTEVRALRVLSDSKADITPGELGTRLGLTTGATTRMLDRLEEAGYVARVRGTVDRRAVYVHMTEQAWSMAGQLGGLTDLGAELRAVHRLVAPALGTRPPPPASGPDRRARRRLESPNQLAAGVSAGTPCRPCPCSGRSRSPGPGRASAGCSSHPTASVLKSAWASAIDAAAEIGGDELPHWCPRPSGPRRTESGVWSQPHL
jgi:DNA-binding MarR family transcriptional regulator